MTRQALLEIWTVYDRPRDFPNTYVARRFAIMAGREHIALPTADIIVSPDLPSLRDLLAARGLVPLNRDDTDDPKIIESWI